MTPETSIFSAEEKQTIDQFLKTGYIIFKAENLDSLKKIHQNLYQNCVKILGLDSPPPEEDFFDIIFQSLKRNNKVKIANFGTFEIREKKKRLGRNPKTKETKIISERKVILFKASKELKRKINYIHETKI